MEVLARPGPKGAAWYTLYRQSLSYTGRCVAASMQALLRCLPSPSLTHGGGNLDNAERDFGGAHRCAQRGQDARGVRVIPIVQDVTQEPHITRARLRQRLCASASLQSAVPEAISNRTAPVWRLYEAWQRLYAFRAHHRSAGWMESCVGRMYYHCLAWAHMFAAVDGLNTVHLLKQFALEEAGD